MKLAGPGAPVTAACVGDSCALVALGHADGCVSLHDARKREAGAQLEPPGLPHDVPVAAVALSPCFGRWVAAVGGTTLRVWSTVTGVLVYEEMGEEDDDGGKLCDVFFSPRVGALLTVRVSPYWRREADPDRPGQTRQGEHVEAASWSLRQVDDGWVSAEVAGPDHCDGWACDGSVYVHTPRLPVRPGVEYRGVQVADVATGQVVCTLKMDVTKVDVLDAAMSPDGRMVCVAEFRVDRDGSNFATLYDARSGEELAQCELPGRAVRVRFAPDSRLLACAVSEEGVFVFDVNEARQGSACGVVKHVWVFDGGDKCMAWSASGQQLAVSAIGATEYCVADVGSDGALECVVETHSSQVTNHPSLGRLLSSSGAWALATSEDGSVHVQVLEMKRCCTSDE